MVELLEADVVLIVSLVPFAGFFSFLSSCIEFELESFDFTQVLCEMFPLARLSLLFELW